jgi:nucleotide-binding universal stress UspA family protein
MYHKVMVTTDGSALSKKAVSHAIGLCQATGAELLALRVTPRFAQSYFEGSLPLSANEVSKIEQRWSDAAESTLNAVVKQAETKGVKVKALVVKSDIISDAIIAAARKSKVDLIVMASHGRRGLKRLLLGSETQQVLTHSNVPVLVLR